LFALFKAIARGRGRQTESIAWLRRSGQTLQGLNSWSGSGARRFYKSL